MSYFEIIFFTEERSVHKKTSSWMKNSFHLFFYWVDVAKSDGGIIHNGLLDIIRFLEILLRVFCFRDFEYEDQIKDPWHVYSHQNLWLQPWFNIFFFIHSYFDVLVIHLSARPLIKNIQYWAIAATITKIFTTRNENRKHRILFVSFIPDDFCLNIHSQTNKFIPHMFFLLFSQIYSSLCAVFIKFYIFTVSIFFSPQPHKNKQTSSQKNNKINWKINFILVSFIFSTVHFFISSIMVYISQMFNRMEIL